ncbi:uncharacterized protein LOC110707155 [Chenopodium quinoa]|uniref:uncharacterized protein LOC110707155 n=1 Tax=Chenopodium quinoa TaxID=63459 RepID=UPI000B77B1D1|nr:uncharacterized protein LOC110707155 [Chenopodium quinoa]
MVKKYSIQRNQFYTTVTSNEKVLHLRCKKNCGWSLRGTKKSEHSDGFTIVTYKGPHRDTCVTEVLSTDHAHLDSSIISDFVKSFVQKDSYLKVEFIQELISKHFQFDVTYRRAWYAREKVIAEVFGDWESSYGRLPHFMEALKQSNPGTVVVWKHKVLVDGVYYSNMEVFERVFWVFGPCVEGFKHCMSIICIDGTHLYGKFKGTLLVAASVDANFQVFPLAFALVEGQNTSSWSWFLGCIRVHVTQRDGLCVISDRHAGIIAAMNDPNVGFTEPRAYHRFCVRHLASNLKTHVRRNDMRDIWFLFHDAGRRYGICTTNFSEIFNNVLKGARFLPIMSLVELTFHRVNKYFTDKRELSQARSEQGLAYPPKFTSIMEKNISKARYHKVEAYNRRLHIYQVETKRGDRIGRKGGHRHTVNFQLRMCTCNKPRIFHLPCSHVLAVCAKYSISERPWVDRVLQSEAYTNTYTPQFWPIPCETAWRDYGGPKLIPDNSMVRGQGRPKSRRIRNEMDETNRPASKCGLCHQQGHNKRSCPSRSTGH